MRFRSWLRSSSIHTALGGLLRCVAVLSVGCILPTRAQVVDTSLVTQAEDETRKRIGKRRDDATRAEPGDAAPSSDSRAVPRIVEAADRHEGAFCRATRPLLRELRGTVGRHVRCTSARYLEAGYFGTTLDIASSSFHNACFYGSAAYGELLRYQEVPIPAVASRIVEVMKIGVDARIDLSRYGIAPAVYVLDDPRDITAVTVEIAFLDPVVRSPTNLGHVLEQLATDPRVPTEIQGSASSCRAQLCAKESVYTSDIVSASPRIRIILQDGEAGGLRPIDVNAAVSITRSGRVFEVRPASRVNLAARFRPSRTDLGSACLATREVEPEPPGWTPRCGTIIHHGVHVTLEGCQRSSPMVVMCRFSLLSPGRDRQLKIHVDRGRDDVSSTLVDSKGSSRTARMGNAGNEWEDQQLIVPLVANVATSASLEFRDIASTASHASRVRLRAATDRELEFDFRGIELQGELQQCRSGGDA